MSPCATQGDAIHEMNLVSRAPCSAKSVENDFQEKCRKGAKFAAHTAFPAILGEISCLFSLALEFFTRFRGGSFQPLTHLSGKQSLDSVVGLRRSAKSAGLFVGR